MLPPPVTLKPLRAFEYLSCDFGSSFSISCSLKAPSERVNAAGAWGEGNKMEGKGSCPHGVFSSSFVFNLINKSSILNFVLVRKGELEGERVSHRIPPWPVGAPAGRSLEPVCTFCPRGPLRRQLPGGVRRPRGALRGVGGRSGVCLCPFSDSAAMSPAGPARDPDPHRPQT